MARNLVSARYDPATQTLRVQLRALDASAMVATYSRAPALDVNGYQAFTMQESERQRKFLALFAASERRTVSAGVVADAGQANRAFGGGTFSRIDVYSAPTSGLATYMGSYAGVITLTGPLDPAAPARTAGDVVLNADFTDGSVNGEITNRRIVHTGDALDPLALTVTGIAPNGSFLGEVEFLGQPIRAIGSYAGLFGGREASDVAGVLVITPIDGEDAIFEHGVFVLPRCGTPGDSAACPP